MSTPRIDAISALPLHQWWGVTAIDSDAGAASFSITVDAHSANPNGVLHGGVVYALCDVAAYAALVPSLGDGEDAVTHDLHVSVMRAARLGERVTFSGRVMRRGRTLVFLDAEARCDDRVLATARVTKSVVARLKDR